MKLKNLILQRYRSQVVRQFGNAKLIRRPNGHHGLVGGTDADRADAFEWSSLFAHEIVFTHFHREDHARSRPRKPWFAPRLQPVRCLVPPALRCLAAFGFLCHDARRWHDTIPEAVLTWTCPRPNSPGKACVRQPRFSPTFVPIKVC
jgi:hypothetical protein